MKIGMVCMRVDGMNYNWKSHLSALWCVSLIEFMTFKTTKRKKLKQMLWQRLKL